MTHKPNELRRRKQMIRLQAEASRADQEGKDPLSRRICRRLAELPEFAAAAAVMFYIDAGNEARTRPFVPAVWESGKQVVVPYCDAGRLMLFRIEQFEDLSPGTYGILEPALECRSRGDRETELSQIDLVVVPGVAFDRLGGRLGHGKGYYDKLLAGARPDTALVALAFECQLFDEVPMLPHDVYVHKVITEIAVYERRSLRE